MLLYLFLVENERKFDLLFELLGMGLSKGKILGKMVFWELIVQFLQIQTSRISSKPKTRLVATHISLQH